MWKWSHWRSIRQKLYRAKKRIFKGIFKEWYHWLLSCLHTDLFRLSQWHCGLGKYRNSLPKIRQYWICNNGQVHDMFSRIFRIRIYEFFVTNITKYYVIFVMIFSNCSKLRRRWMPFLSNREFVIFFKWEILLKKFVDLYLENSWKHVVSSILVEF